MAHMRSRYIKKTITKLPQLCVSCLDTLPAGDAAQCSQCLRYTSMQESEKKANAFFPHFRIHA